MKYSLTVLSLRSFIRAFTMLRDVKSAYEALQKMVILAIRGSNSVYIHANGKFSSSNLDIPIPSKLIIGLKQSDSSMLGSDASSEDQGTILKLLSWSFNDVIYACACLKKYWLVGQLIAQV